MLAVSLGLGLLLGAASPALGQSPDPATSQTATTIRPSPSDGGPPPSSTPAVKQIDEYLLMITGNNEPHVRLIGARGLLENGAEEAASQLKDILCADPPDLAAQIAVCRALADFEDPMPALTDPVMALLGDARPGLNEAVVEALRQFDNGMVVDRLRGLAADATTDVERCNAAIGALGEMSANIKAVAALIALIRDNEGRIRRAALTALADATGIHHADAASALAWWKEHETTQPLDWMRTVNERRAARIRELRDHTARLTVRLVASYRESYLRIAEPDRPKKLLTYLGDELMEVRGLGLDLINVLITDRKEINQEIKARLLEMIGDPDQAIRMRIAVMVGDLRMTGAVPSLVEVLSREPDHLARAAQVNAIGRLDGVIATPTLIEHLHDEVASVAGETALALAEISRRKQDDPQTVDTIAPALLQRFTEIPIEEEALRVQFLDAMTRIGAESFRTVFKAETGPDRGVLIRRAAVAGLGGYGDLAAADEVRPLITATEPQIRLAAVQAMGKCGRRAEDLEALANRLDSASEPEHEIRDRAWEGFKQIAQRQAPTEWVAVSDQFAKVNDTVAQRRRLELLTFLTGNGQKFKQLSTDDQIGVHERMADAHEELGAFPAAAACLDQALGLAKDGDIERLASLATRRVTMLLRGRQDQLAVEQIKGLAETATAAKKAFDPKSLTEAVTREVRARNKAAVDASTFADAMGLIGLMSADAVAGILPTLAQQLTTAQDELIEKRNTALDRLLNAMATDPQAETKLVAYGKELVLPRLHAKLTAIPTTSAPTNGIEDKLVNLARKFVSEWPGYKPGCPPEERTKALDALRALWSAPAPVQPAETTTAPAATSS